MSGTVLITDYNFKNVDHERAAIEGAGFQLRTAQCKTPQEVIAAAQDADVLIVQWAPINREVIAALPRRVKAVIRYGIGVDNVDVDAASARGLAVANIPDYCIDEVADHTLALALTLLRQLPQTHARTMAREWKIIPPRPMPAARDMTFACAGFGRIARAVLERASAFGFRLAAYDPFVSAEEFQARGVKPCSRDEFFSADLLSLHLPLNADTRHFVDRSRLQSLRASTLIVNTSRGGLIDTTALAEALTAGQLGAAGLDVYEAEPLPLDHPLRAAPNVMLTSHTAWYSESSLSRLQEFAAAEALNALRGQPLKNLLNRKALSGKNPD